MSIKIYNGTAWQDVVSIKKYDGTAWVDVQSVKAYEGGAWVEKWSSGKILAPTTTDWYLMRRKENSGVYGTITVNATNIYMVNNKAPGNYTSCEVDLMSKAKIDFSKYTKLRITYTYTKDTGLTGQGVQIYGSTALPLQIGDYSANIYSGSTAWDVLNAAQGNGGTLTALGTLALSNTQTTVEINIDTLNTLNYLILRVYVNNSGSNTGNQYMTINEVKFV